MLKGISCSATKLHSIKVKYVVNPKKFIPNSPKKEREILGAFSLKEMSEIESRIYNGIK